MYTITAVALAIEAGGHPKQIQEMLGHASITTTLNVYGHLFRGLRDELALRLAETFEASRAAKMRPNRGTGPVHAPTALAQ